MKTKLFGLMAATLLGMSSVGAANANSYQISGTFSTVTYADCSIIFNCDINHSPAPNGMGIGGTVDISGGVLTGLAIFVPTGSVVRQFTGFFYPARNGFYNSASLSYTSPNEWSISAGWSDSASADNTAGLFITDDNGALTASAADGIGYYLSPVCLCFPIFEYSGLTGTVTADLTPIPAALPLFATGLGALGLLGWRRKRKAAAIASKMKLRSSKMLASCLAAPLVVGFMAFANVASATTFSYSNYTEIDSQGLVITSPTNTTPTPFVTSAGEIVLKGSGADTGISLATWCLDIYDPLAHSGTFALSPLATSGAGGLNPMLTPTEIGEIGGLMHFGKVALATHTAPLGGVASDYSAAVQIAIWSIEYESVGWAYKFAPASVTSLVSLLVTDIGNGDIANSASGFALAQEGNQTLGFLSGPACGSVGDGDSSCLPPTPLPAALPLFATGLGALGLLGWRRKRKAAAAIAA